MSAATDLPARLAAAGPDERSVLGKVRLLLDAFAIDDTGLSLAEIVRRTGLAKPTVHRLCQELVGWGLVERDPAGYRLGLALFEMGQRVPRQRVLRDAALPHLEELFVATRETVHCAVLDGFEVVYIEKISGYRQVGRPSRIAGRMPLHCTATGKALLAFGAPSLREAALARPLSRRTPRTITSAHLLQNQLAAVVVNGFAVEHEETRLGHSSVAAPIFGPSGVLAGALSVTAPTSRVHVSRLSTVVRQTAGAVTRALARPAVRPAGRPDPRGGVAHLFPACAGSDSSGPDRSALDPQEQP